MNAMRTMLAVTLAACCVYAQPGQAMVILSNGQTQVVWHVGDPDPSIDENVAWFSVAVCGPELTWLSSKFPGLPMRALTNPPADFDCVIYRGDDARFIADNLVVNGNQ
ncbi:MAG: hypothetical protein ACREYD_05505 [Casimicrobiaceae bacterium]